MFKFIRKGDDKNINNNTYNDDSDNDDNGYGDHILTPSAQSSPFMIDTNVDNISTQSSPQQQQQQQNSDEYKIINWLKNHNVWFNDKIGNNLLTTLIDSGITQPNIELSLLPEWPDLIQISDAANLNIIQRRKFINSIHNPISNISINDDLTMKKLSSHPYHPLNNSHNHIHHLPLGFFIPGPSEYYNKYSIFNNKNNNDIKDQGHIDHDNIDYNNIDKLLDRDNEIKHILVMSDAEQESLARMDSIISQLHITRNLIRRRCEALDSGSKECENIIKKEFDLLRKLLTEREENIINQLIVNKNKRIKQLNNIDVDIELALKSCHKAKYRVEKILEDDTRYSGASWAVLTARQDRAKNVIDRCIEYQVENINKNNIKQRYSISSLIHTDMDIDNLLAFQTFSTAKNIGVGIMNIKDNNIVTTPPPSTIDNNISDNHFSFNDILFNNIKSLQDIEKETFAKHGFGENSYATHELNVFVRSPSQIRLRMCLPGFSFQRNQKTIHEMIREYGAITDVEKSVDKQMSNLFKSVSKIPQHKIAAINIEIDAASFVNKITKTFDDQTEIYKFDNHRSLSVEVDILPNPDDAVKAAKLANKHYGNRDDYDDDDDDDDDINYYGSPVNIIRIYEVELQIAREPIPPQDAIDEYIKIRKRRDSYDSDFDLNDNNNNNNKTKKKVKYDLNSIDPTLLDWITLGWKKIKSQKFNKNKYDEEQDKISKNIDIKINENWWKEQRTKLLSKINLNEWPLKHQIGKPDDEIIKLIDDKKSVDNIICSDLLIRSRMRDFLKVYIIKKNDNNDDNVDNVDNKINDSDLDNKLSYMDIRDEILVSQSSYSPLSFMNYDLRLPPEEPEDHYGVIILFSDRSLRFYDLYDNKLITLSQGVPGDHINLPGLCSGLIPYQKPSSKKINNNDDDDDDDDDSDSDSDSSVRSNSISKPIKSIIDLNNNDDIETEYELKPTIIRCGGSLSKKATSYCDMFDIEKMEWIRIQKNMHCNRVYTQSIIINNKLFVIGGEVFKKNNNDNDNDNDDKKQTPHDIQPPFGGLTRRISAIEEDNIQFQSILDVEENKSCIEEYDFELSQWNILCNLSDCYWNHSVCSITKSYNLLNNNTLYNNINTSFNLTSQSSEIFIAGGYSTTKNIYLSKCFIYNINKDNIINISSMKYLHSCSSAISFDFSINENQNNNSNTYSLYNNKNNKNNKKNNNKIYVIGGQLMGISHDRLSQKNKLMQSMLSKQFKCVEIYNLSTKKWEEGESLKYNHGFYPCVWIQNLLDYKQKRSKEEKERLKRMNKINKMNKNNKKNTSIDPQPIYTIFVTGNACSSSTFVEYLEPKTKKWKRLDKEIGKINIGNIKSIKNEIFKSRKFTPYAIRDDILDRFDKKQINTQHYGIVDEL